MSGYQSVCVCVCVQSHREACDDDAPGDEQDVGDGLSLQVGVGDAGVSAEEAPPVRGHGLQLARKERDGGWGHGDTGGCQRGPRGGMCVCVVCV